MQAMSSRYFVTLKPTGRVLAILPAQHVVETGLPNGPIPFDLLNRGDEPGLCNANLCDRIDRGDSIALATMECLSV